jgi:hypothetical protein
MCTLSDLNQYISNPELNTYLHEYRHKSKGQLDPLVLMRDDVAFRPMQWLKMGLHVQKHSVLGSEEALVLTSKTVFVFYSPTFYFHLSI